MNTTQTKSRPVPTSCFRGTKEVCTLCEMGSSRFFRSAKFGVLVCRVCSKGTYQNHYGDDSVLTPDKAVTL